APRGGHNIIEPAAAGAPVVIGPNMQNFASITSDFLQANAVIQIQNSGELVSAIQALLLDRGLAQSLGKRAQSLIERNAGVSARIADALLPSHLLGHFRT